ncbi:MAG TPA: hypothetical protein V6C81_29515 [Planktothrix sp.]|jgi:hypothetical protein
MDLIKFRAALPPSFTPGGSTHQTNISVEFEVELPEMLADSVRTSADGTAIELICRCANKQRDSVYRVLLCRVADSVEEYERTPLNFNHRFVGTVSGLTLVGYREREFAVYIAPPDDLQPRAIILRQG